MRLALMTAVLFMAAGCGTGSPQQSVGPGADAARGQLLYETACAACHTTQAHWRDKRVVRSWGDLVYQVTRWQSVAGQNWSADEVGDVAAYLNRRFYGLSCPTPGCMGPSARAGAD
jgi:mono/diheme cytochrome c family protein